MKKKQRIIYQKISFFIYVQNNRKNLQLRNDKEWFLTADIFVRKLTNEVKNTTEENNDNVVPAPSNTTHIFQALDLTVNRCCKAFLRKNTQD